MANAPLALTFRCPPELEPILPKPIPAVMGLPEWFRALPHEAFNARVGEDIQTLKKCPPFIDAMTFGFLMPLAADVTVNDGEFTWNTEFSGSSIVNYTRSPIDFHDPTQVAGTPFFQDDRFIVKFNNFWTVEAPEGYSLLFTHPVNRTDLPFTTLTGLVDCDTFRDGMVNFPARWHDDSFNGVLPKGTPVAQCIPGKRDGWTARFETLSNEAIERFREINSALKRETDVYRRQFRAAKR